MSHLFAFIIASTFVFAQSLETLTGTFKGTARNQSGVLQLGGAGTNTMFQLQHVGDSLRLSGLASGGQQRVLASWPLSRVTFSGETMIAKGLTKGPLHLRRTCTWTQSAGIRVQATIRTQGASQAPDDYFGGSEVTLTLMKVR